MFRFKNRSFPFLAAACLVAVAAAGLAGLEPVNAPAQAVGAIDATPQVGDRVNTESFHAIVRPGIYGLGEPRPGDAYGLTGGVLVRVDSATGQILSILRPQHKILD